MLVQREQGDFEDFEVVRRDSGHVVVDLPSAVVNQPRCGLLFNEVQFVAGGRYVASPIQAARGNGCERASVELWNTTSGRMHKIDVPVRACPGAVQSVGLSLDDRTMVVGCSTQNLATGFRGRLRGTVARIDISSPMPRVLSVDPVAVSPDSLTVSTDGLVVAVAEEDLAGAGVEVMTVDRGRLRGSPVERGNGNGVGPVAFAPDGDYVATSFGDGRLELWRTASSVPERTELMVPGPQGADSLAFSPDSTRLAVGDSKGTCASRDVATGTVLGTLTRQPSSIDDLAFTRRGVLIVASSPYQASTAPRPYMVSLATTVPEWTRAVCGITHRDLSAKQWSQCACHRRTSGPASHSKRSHDSSITSGSSRSGSTGPGPRTSLIPARLAGAPTVSSSRGDRGRGSPAGHGPVKGRRRVGSTRRTSAGCRCAFVSG